MSNINKGTVFGLLVGGVAGGLTGAAIGRNLSRGTRPGEDNPLPAGLGLFGAIAGAWVFAAVGSSMANPDTSTVTTTATVADNTSNANGLPNLPPPGA